MQGKNIVRVIGVTAALLLIPLIAMIFTSSVKWNLTDFIIAAVLLLSAGLLYEYMATKLHKTWQRIAVALAIAAILTLIWVQLAVGIFD